MAESLLFGVAQAVLGKIASSAVQEIGYAWGVESELQKLESTLSAIKAVLLDAEDKQVKNHQLSDWLVKLKDVVYDADDVLDEFEYESLRSQVMKSEGTRRKVRNFFSSSNPFAFRAQMAHRIKEITERLDDISAEKSKFHLTQRNEDMYVMHKREMTHSFVRDSDVIGRDVDKENIIKHLINKIDHGDNISVIPVVGIGGLGKTTLAKLVYNDDRVKKHFQVTIWVCVSDEFDISKLIKEIIKSVKVENIEEYTFDQLQTCLRDTLRCKRFLLILDDVWNEDREKWVGLRDLLLDGASGSKIIVTTRSPLVASIVGTVSAYNLDGLSLQHCSSLFVKCAFKEGQEKQHPNLMKIGNEIVKKCGGVPLAVRTLGSLLYLKTDERDWIFIRDNEIWKLEQRESHILPALRLSYEQLPSYLKHCFSCCSLFPKDYLFRSMDLIQLWMALGLISSSNEGQELEEIGKSYIRELWSRSFFQDAEVREDGFIHDTRFKMHDLMHDLALLVAQGECSTVNIHTKNISRTVRHVSFCDSGLSRNEVPKLLLDVSKLQTVIFPMERVGTTSASFVKTCISRFKYMRALDLSSSSFEVLPSSIGDLKHLRLLNLSGSNIKKVPKSISKLYKLETLRLECWALEELPSDILRNLMSLRSLYVTTNQMSLEIGSIVSLRVLKLQCGSLKFLDEGMEHHIQRGLPRLSLQVLYFHGVPELEALPQWLQGAAGTLQHMCIAFCPNLLMLPAWLQDFTSLQTLEISWCYKLSSLPEGMDRLVALKKLKISHCPELIRRCRPLSGEDWPKIAHVQDITLDEIKIKQSSNRVYNDLLLAVAAFQARRNDET